MPGWHHGIVTPSALTLMLTVEVMHFMRSAKENNTPWHFINVSRREGNYWPDTTASVCCAAIFMAWDTEVLVKYADCMASCTYWSRAK